MDYITIRSFLVGKAGETGYRVKYGGRGCMWTQRNGRELWKAGGDVEDSILK